MTDDKRERKKASNFKPLMFAKGKLSQERITAFMYTYLIVMHIQNSLRHYCNELENMELVYSVIGTLDHFSQ